MCSDDQHQQVLDALHFIGKRLTVRPFIDTNYWVSDSQGFTLDYKDRRHLYLFCETALTFVIPSLGNYATAAGQWVGFEFREGLKIFTTGQTNPVQVVIRASDEIPLEGTQPVSGTIIANQGTSPWVTSVSNVNANGQATMANSSPVVLASDQTPLTTATGTPTTVASSASSVIILASNGARKGFLVWNDSTQILYLLFKTGGTASNTVYSVQVGSQQGYEWPGQPIYTGDVIGIWASANGNARVTEFT